MRALVALTIVVLALSACGTTPSPSALASADATPDPVDSPYADAWVDATADTIGTTADYSNRVELADVNADGTVDLLFANGGNYEEPGEPVASQVFANNGDGTFTDITTDVFGDMVDLVRVIKVRDLNGDGLVDVVLGTVFERQSRLLLGSRDGSFTDVTATNLPEAALSVGDLEIGDVNLDGHLDIVLVDWGDGNPFDSEGRVMLWLNYGKAVFKDVTAEYMPDRTVGFSWELELIDVDNDWDLDIATSCKVCEGGLLYENTIGAGLFADVTEGRMPATTNNYEFEPIDLDGDGFLDLVTINDGTETGLGLAEHVFRNERGSFVDVTDDWWPPNANLGYDDAVAIPLDIESDGDADFIVASLDGPDRLLLNDGSGGLTLVTGITDASPSRGTLGWGIADLNGDGRPDMVESQGEVPGHHDERVYLATDAVPPDTAPPIIVTNLDRPSSERTIVARVHDNRTPNMPHDWQAVEVRWDGGELPMTWYGENLFFAPVTSALEDASSVQVCAVDAAGNEACAP